MIYEYTNDLPIVTVNLYHAGQTISIQAVVDSGAMVSVLPYECGHGKHVMKCVRYWDIPTFSNSSK